jgi:N-methylhydantoinase A/oxoprolinase/acetone carboxylase beta subunit
MAITLGIDTGGTYSDAVLFDEARGAGDGVIATAKALTTRHDLSIGIAQAVDNVLSASGVAPRDIAMTSLSTTLATNALVEGHGGRVCLVLIGFEEKALARAGLAEALAGDPVIHLAGGHDTHGNSQLPLDLATLSTALNDVEVSGFAVAGYFAVRNPEHELAARELIIERTGRPVTCSHELSSQLDGPRRALTSVLNARLIPLIHHLIQAAEGLFAERGITAPMMVVRGDGALISASMAKLKPIETILSGPAASLVGAAYLTGTDDAMVSDIGGTTTDIAVMRGGQPTLDPRGATVGGWRTMVEAVAMRTIGLGGDSEIQVTKDGAEPLLILGPRRLMPISLLVLEYPAIHRNLDQQLSQGSPSSHVGRFAVRIRDADDLLAPDDRAMFDQLGDRPQPLDAILRGGRQRAVLDRLVRRGLVLISGFTPSDAAHVLGLHGQWDAEAAGKAAEIFARSRTPRHDRIASDAEAISRMALAAMVARSADALLEAALAEDGFRDTGLSRHPLALAGLEKSPGLTRIDIGLTTPIIALGASANVHYPGVASCLGTSARIPEHAGVANAIGAVVGRISVTVRATIAQPTEGLFRVHGDGSPVDFTSLDTAAAHAETQLRHQAEKQALAAGADEVELTFERADQVANVGRIEIFVESALSAIATGRPRLG